MLRESQLPFHTRHIIFSLRILEKWEGRLHGSNVGVGENRIVNCVGIEITVSLSERIFMDWDS